MGNSVIIRTPIPTAEEVADRLGLSLERRKYLSQLARSGNIPARAKAKAADAATKKAPARKAA